MMSNLVPKNQGDDGPSGSGRTSSASVSINSLKAVVGNSLRLVTTDLDKLQKAYEEKIRSKRGKIARLKTELENLKRERDLYSDKFKSLERDNSKQKEIIAEREKEIVSLKAWSS